MDVLTLLRAQWDRACAVLAFVLAVVLLVLGYIGISGTQYVAEQLPYIISGGLAALLLIAVGVALWLSADLRDEWRKLDSLDSRLERAFGGADET
jgi:membrane protein YdbS with pleckstrin-like domain